MSHQHQMWPTLSIIIIQWFVIDCNQPSLYRSFKAGVISQSKLETTKKLIGSSETKKTEAKVVSGLHRFFYKLNTFQ